MYVSLYENPCAQDAKVICAQVNVGNLGGTTSDDPDHPVIPLSCQMVIVDQGGTTCNFYDPGQVVPPTKGAAIDSSKCLYRAHTRARKDPSKTMVFFVSHKVE